MTIDPSGDPLDTARIRAALAGRSLGAEIEVHELLSSTSDRARDLARAGAPHGLVVLAEFQTAGRGRRENRWHAQPRRDLLFSVLLRRDARAGRFPRLATLAALGFCRAIEHACAVRPRIKWPNDLQLGGRKFCGILSEAFHAPGGPFLVLGAGVNVNRAGFPPELRESATSLRRETGMILDRTQLAVALLLGLDEALGFWDEGFDGVLAQVRDRSALLGRRIRARVGDIAIEGLARDLGPEGQLVIERDDGSFLDLTGAEQVRAC